ncbi:MAG: PD-(D/E)XK nuclease family protein, partial [Rickettsiales bacterium]|nr:PD-(D/E)XK nuclease family protein [Rickettsiales bacterium]
RGLASLSPYDFLTQVLEVSNRREDFARRFGQQVHEVLDELKAQAASMPVNMPQTIAQFYDWMVASRRQIKREQEASGANLLRIITVHGAKGLEAPVVILADTVEVPTTQRETVFAVTSQKQQPLAALSISAISKFSPMLMLAKEAKKEAILAEYHRLLYVAMTRARDELHVFGSASKKGEIKEGAWYETIRAAMNACGATVDGDVLILADAVSEPQAYAAPLAKMAQPPLPAWAKAQVPHAQANARSLSPSRFEVDGASPYATASSNDARTRGVRIHRMLELMRADANTASITQLLRYVAPDWDEAMQREIVTKLEALVAQQPWLWAHKRMAEVNVCGTITHQGHSIPVAGQIDVLIEKADEIIILDYKTGSHVPANDSEVSLSYILQLKIYQALVRQIYPALPVRCAIVWTHDARLMWLDARVEHTSFPELNDMLKTDVAA